MENLTFTEEALQYVHKRLATDPTVNALSLGIKKAGCSGFAYDIHFAKIEEGKETENTSLLLCGELKVLVDKKALSYFKNTLVDCVKDDFGEYLKFTNPNVKGACGCGESFTFEEIPS